FTDNTSIVEEQSRQDLTALSNMTSFTYDKEQGITVLFSHTYNRNKTVSSTTADAPTNNVVSTTHMFMNQIAIPKRKLNYHLGIRNNVSLLSDNTGYSNNLYSTAISNAIELYPAGWRVQPVYDLKLAYNTQNEITSTEIQNHLALRGEKRNLPTFGNMTTRLEFTHRRKASDGASDVKRLWVFDMTMMRKFSNRFRMSLLMDQQLEQFGGTSPVTGAGSHGDELARPDEHRSTYKVDLQATPVTNLTVGSGIMLLVQNNTTITRWMVSLNARVPKLNLPIRTTVSREVRDITGLPQQSRFSAETKVSYQFRRINFLLTHKYTREVLVANTFSLTEITAKLTRQFSAF
ncbi:MAG: hypothetical protein D6800_14495, partial [Candidatus Zixiibacteriota bacterium]